MVECPQGVQLLQGQDQGLRRGRVHEVEMDEVIDTETLQQQHHIPEVSALDLKRGMREEGIRMVIYQSVSNTINPQIFIPDILCFT